MFRNLCVLIALLVASATFAATGPKAQSMDTTVAGGKVNFAFLQDGTSLHPGFTWERELFPRVVGGVAAVYSLTGQRVCGGPVIGYQVLKSKYFNLTPMLGVLQDIGGVSSRTRFSYGIEASLDLTSLLSGPNAPATSSRGASLMSVAEPPLDMNGFGVHTSYSRRNNIGVGVDYTWEVLRGLGVTAMASGVRDYTGNGAFTSGVGADLRVWGNPRNSVSLLGGVDYNWRHNVASPTFGVVYRNACF